MLHVHGCRQSSPPNPAGQLHLPVDSVQLAKCKQSNPGSMQLKQGGHSGQSGSLPKGVKRSSGVAE